MGIVIVNANPVFDRTITLDEFLPGTVMRTMDVEVTAGGKGINVARVLRALRRDATLLVPVGRVDVDRYRLLLEAEGARVELFEVSGEVRVASIYREAAHQRVTVVNDAGYSLPVAEWDGFIEAVEARVNEDDLVLIMGSLPAGLPGDAAARLVKRVKDRGARTLVDTAPQWLAPVLEVGPDVVAPNIHEAASALTTSSAALFDDSRLSDDQARELAQEYALTCAARTSGLACVTAGSAGVAYAHDGHVGWVDAPKVDVVSPVGAGDSFVAGLAAQWGANVAEGVSADWDAAVAFGVACASASCEVVLAGGAHPDRISELAAAITLSSNRPQAVKL